MGKLGYVGRRARPFDGAGNRARLSELNYLVAALRCGFNGDHEAQQRDSNSKGLKHEVLLIPDPILSRRRRK